MIYKNEYENCIHFDGKECRNEESCNYGGYGEFCVDCKDVEGVDNMNNIKIIECLGLDADGFNTYEAKINEINTYIIISFKDINKPKINVNMDKAQEVDRYLMKLGYYSEVLCFNMNVLQACDAYTIDIHLKNNGCTWLKNMIIEYNMKNITNTKELLEYAINQGKFCNNLYKVVYDLTEIKDCHRLFDEYIIKYHKEDNNESYYDVYPSGFGEKDEKVYNILNVKDLTEMKEKGYIITNFHCDDYLIHFSKETFKIFMIEKLFL